jgi:hypothetical protein
MEEHYINNAIKRNNDIIEFMYNNINNIINENPDLINKENIMFISLCRYFANTYIHIPPELLYERLIEDKIIIWNYLVDKYMS